MTFDAGNFTAIRHTNAIAAGRHQHLSGEIKTSKRMDGGQDDPKLRQACQEMESLFIDHLLKQMRATVDKSGFISGGQAEEIFTSMLDTELSKQAATQGGVGLADILYDQLKTQVK